MASRGLGNPGDEFSFLDFSSMSVEAPIKTNSMVNFDPAVIRSDAKDTRVVIHARFPELVQNFLHHKLQHGSRHEKAVYRNLSWQDEVRRLIDKRPLVFMGSSDYTVLRDGRTVHSPAEQWDRNGTSEQDLNQDLTLDEYLSYDEIMLSSLLGVSGPSHFINDGARNNCGRPGRSGTFEERGIIIGLVGARFEREDRMDAAFILPPTKKPRMHPELHQHFLRFFDPQPASTPSNSTTAEADSHNFNWPVYKSRIRITADILLHEAHERAQADPAHRKAHVYVVGLGLGVWQYHRDQAQMYLRAFGDSMTALPAHHRIGTIEFAYIHMNQTSLHQELQILGQAVNISVLFTKRNPAAKLPGDKAGASTIDDKNSNSSNPDVNEDDSDSLLVLSYAWDGNAFPGNEYWAGSLTASGDPAAACMSTIADLHNPLVNREFGGRVRVVG